MTASIHQSHCTRHAFTDGACESHGCHDCPGRFELAYARVSLARQTRRRRLALLAGALAFLAVTSGVYHALDGMERQLRLEARI